MEHISGYNTLVALVEIATFGMIVAGVIGILYVFVPPFKNLFDKIVKGDL